MALKIPSTYQPHIFYGLLSVLVTAPLLKPGFVLTLDMVFTPHMRVPGSVTSSYLFYVLLHVLNSIVPSDVLQKIMLLAIPYLSGWSMYRFTQYTQRAQAVGGQHAVLAAYIGGLFYAVNPFTYDRFMAGQFAVLLGYSLLPFVVQSLLGLLSRPDRRRGVIFGVWLTLVGIVSIHTLGILAVVLVAGLTGSVYTYRANRPRLIRIFTFFGLGLGLMAILSSYWLVPLMLGHGTTAQAVRSFTIQDQRAFATIGMGPIGRLANVLRLQGFWAEGHNLFVLPQAHVIGWGVFVLLLWGLIYIGIKSTWCSGQRFVTGLICSSAGVSVLLAITVGDTILGTTVPFFNSFREPQKFVALLALAYAFFAAEGVRSLLDRYSHAKRAITYHAVLIIGFLLPVLITPTIFWGLGGQLHARRYPSTWAAINTRLDQDAAHYKVLFLPWHLYMYYGFVGRIVASPATNYFDKPVIVSNQMELHGASPTMVDTQKTLLSSSILPQAHKATHLGSQLAPLHIKYILLDKDDDYRTYNYLDHQTDLRLVTQNAQFRLYQNLAYRSTQ